MPPSCACSTPTLIRVGNDQYAKENGSYGLTTLRNRHVRIQGASLKLSFRGKSGVRHDVEVKDRRVLRVVRRCLHLPGQDLFQYLGDDSQRHTIGSGDVDEVSQSLGNTPAVCRKAYIHPEVLALGIRLAALKGDVRFDDHAPPAMAGNNGLNAAEKRLVAFLSALR